MPCNLDGPRTTDYTDYNGRSYQEVKLRKQALRATRAACELAALIKKHNGGDWKPKKNGFGVSAITMKWIKKHEDQDKIRLEKERAIRELAVAKANVLKKLTKKERELLGL